MKGTHPLPGNGGPAAHAGTLRIVLADSRGETRRFVRALLEREPALAVVGEAADGREAVHLAQELAPDVVVMDVEMPGLNGRDATRQIVAASSGVRVIGLSLYAERRFVEAMLDSGASAYVLVERAAEDLVAAIRGAAAPRLASGPAAD